MSTRTQPAEVTATDLRGALARILRDAEYGHPTTITREGRPVARIVHPDAGVTPAPDVWQAAQEAYDATMSGDRAHHRTAADALAALGALLGSYYGYEERADRG